MTFRSFGISNLAWPSAAWPDALRLMRELGVSAIEIAPFDFFKRWDADDDAVRALADEIAGAGMTCPAMQGILYQAPDVHLFASAEARAALRSHLARVARIADLLGAKACVFGAPRQRDPGDLTVAQAWDIAVDFFRAVAPVFADHGAAIAFEANARLYGCRFVVTTREAAAFVAAVGHPGCGLQIDTGTLFLESEDPDVLRAAAPLAVHAHVSEPGLVPIGSAGVDHAPIAAALRASGYAGSLSIEMKAVPEWRTAVAGAVTFVRGTYAS
jgi:sugar phosphate isomerase/epimerase